MNRRTVAMLVVLLLVALMAPAAGAHERSDGGYYTIVDEAGNPVYITGWKVEEGDQCLTPDNKRYEVVSLEGNIARAKFIGQVDLTAYAPVNPPSGNKLAGPLAPKTAEAQENKKVAVYHTHSDESYVPTDGEESIKGNGGIFKVGDAFTTALQSKGLEVVHSMAKHDPHDDMAYERSRRTAADLVKQQPAAIFDIHRDAVPPEVYSANIDGQNVSKVQLVVGKYGPTGKQIEDYALQLKAAADQQHPGLVKGIFFAKGGDYNQDLHPRSMLLEVGAHTNDRPSAERGVSLFADIIPTVLGATSGAPGAPAGATGLGTANAGASGASKSIGWIVGLLVVGVAAFLFLSTGGAKEAGAKLKQFGKSEFANFIGPKLNRFRLKKKSNGEDDNK
ncbi:MAG TPA: stage II sporulation protein P [Selenomonadales bacterium]|nr:stage II sporulation protein P [Selenomonadales bacterium]